MPLYVDHLDLDTKISRISHGDYGFYIPATYEGYESYQIRFGNCVTSIYDNNFRVSFPLDWFLDRTMYVHTADEFWYEDNGTLIPILSDDHFYMYPFLMVIADYEDSATRLSVLGHQIEIVPFRLRSDYDCAETDYHFDSGDEFCHANAGFEIRVDPEHDADYAEAEYIYCGYYENAAHAFFSIKYSGNSRYITRIRFKERKEFGSVYYKFEYMIPDLQVWNLFKVIDARVNDEIVPYWSPILQNPCYANIYRSEEWIDIYVDPVWGTEVRMVIYNTEDPFNRTGIIELAIFEDITNIWADAIKIGWINEYEDVDQYTAVHLFKVGFHPFIYDQPDFESFVNSLKVCFVACHPHVEDYVANDVKIYFYPLYIFEFINFEFHHDKPYIDTGFFLDTLDRGYNDHGYYMPILSAAIATGDFILHVPECEDVPFTVIILSEDVPVDGNFEFRHDKPYKEACMFLPIPDYTYYDVSTHTADYVDANTLISFSEFTDVEIVIPCFNEEGETADTYIDVMATGMDAPSFYLDTMPSAMIAGDFIFAHDIPYRDSSYCVDLLGLSYEDSDASISIAMTAESEGISGSYNIGLKTEQQLSGSFNISGGTVEYRISGSYNVYGAITNYGLYVHILTDEEVYKLRDAGVFEEGIDIKDCE